MDEHRWGRVKELVIQALELPTVDRRVLLEAENDTGIREEAAELIAASRLVSGTDALQTPYEPESWADLATGAQVGPWKLREQIGVGGMGAVYRAERADGAYERTVALKLLHHGSHTTELARRLRVEQNVLARLEHPYIARLYDGGVTGPEYVNGVGVPVSRDGSMSMVKPSPTTHTQKHLLFATGSACFFRCVTRSRMHTTI